jgi:hypothetical protein
MKKLLLILALAIPMSAALNTITSMDPLPRCYPCPPIEEGN